MTKKSVNPHGFDEYKLAHESRQKSVDRLLKYREDTRNRIDTLIKAVFVLSGGALTISIGLFLRSEAPILAVGQVQLLRTSWALLFYSLVASSSILFLMICQGYWYAALWENAFSANENTFKSSIALRLVRFTNWLLGITGFVSFLLGLGFLTCVTISAVSTTSNI